jgi:pyridoxal phosphate enzyme (YggS family)
VRTGVNAELPDATEVAAFRLRRQAVLERIARAAEQAGRDPAQISLVAVSKTVPADRLRAAVAAGLTVLGENRVQEGEQKRPSVEGATWHLIGPLQSNKARRALETYDVVESIDSLGLASRLARLVIEVRSPDARLPVLLQVNVDDDPAKAGFLPDELAADLPAVLDLAGLRVDGLMTVGRLVDDPESARPTFRRLRLVAARLRAADRRLGSELSMGMSADFEVAIEEGATIVRVGRALFGERPAIDDTRL